MLKVGKKKLAKYAIDKENLAFKNSILFQKLESFLPSLARENERIKSMDATEIDIEAVDAESCEQFIEMNLDLGVFDVNIQSAEVSDIVFKEPSGEDGLDDEVLADKRLEALAATSNIPLISTSPEILSKSEESLDKISIRMAVAPSLKLPLICKLNDNAPSILKDVLQENGWITCDDNSMDDTHWNMYWKGSRFTKNEYLACREYQRMNHFPGTGVVTRKEELSRLFKMLRCIYGDIYDFTPISFCVPNEYKKFLREFQHDADKGQKSVWISKPADLSRGRGIYLFKELHELTYDCNTIIQRYIDRPLLISGFKFDLRCYVVVRSYDPLIVYFYRDGLARFATEPYNLSSLANRFSHLTNTSINMLSPSLDQEKDEVGPGCKWDFGKLRHYMAGKDIDIDQIWKKIKGQILLTLLPIAQQVPKVSNGLFELYGFDFLVDESFHTWLLEINLSPSLSVDSDVDKLVKKPLIQDILLLLDFKTNEDIKIHPSFVSQKNNSIYAPSEIGNFNRIFPDKVLPCNRKFDDRRVKKLIFEVKHKYFGET